MKAERVGVMSRGRSDHQTTSLLDKSSSAAESQIPVESMVTVRTMELLKNWSTPSAVVPQG